MAIVIDGSGTIAGITPGGLPDGSVTTAEIADANVTIAKLSATGTPSATTYLRGDDTWAAISGTPAGTVIFYAASTAPTGYLKANGAAVSRTTYAALFAAIGTTFGAGDGSTTFALPDLRGEFPRGWDDGRGVDSGRVFGSAQLDATQRVVGKFRMAHASGLVSQATAGFVNPFAGTDGASAWRDQIEAPGSGFYAMEFDNSRSARTASESRPRNVALLPCIKF